MSTEPPATTTITVKSVPVDAWTLANRARKATGESMGTFIGRAVTQLAEQTLAMPTTFPPAGLPNETAGLPALAQPVNRAGLDDLERMASVAISTAAAQQKPLSRDLARLINRHLKARLTQGKLQ